MPNVIVPADQLYCSPIVETSSSHTAQHLIYSAASKLTVYSGEILSMWFEPSCFLESITHYLRSPLALLPFTNCHAFSSLPPSSISTTISLSGHIDPSEIFSFVYAPFNVTSDVTSITVYQNYSYKGAGNALDLGIFDPNGISPINSETGFSGSRGWSGGSRSNFTISAADATPGYNAGPLLPGT